MDLPRTSSEVPWTLLSDRLRGLRGCSMSIQNPFEMAPEIFLVTDHKMPRPNKSTTEVDDL